MVAPVNDLYANRIIIDASPGWGRIYGDTTEATASSGDYWGSSSNYHSLWYELDDVPRGPFLLAVTTGVAAVPAMNTGNTDKFVEVHAWQQDRTSYSPFAYCQNSRVAVQNGEFYYGAATHENFGSGLTHGPVQIQVTTYGSMGGSYPIAGHGPFQLAWATAADTEHWSGYTNLVQSGKTQAQVVAEIKAANPRIWGRAENTTSTFGYEVGSYMSTGGYFSPYPIRVFTGFDFVPEPHWRVGVIGFA